MSQFQGTVWITGASSGLGFAIAEKYLLNGWRVIVSSRSKGQLDALLDDATDQGVSGALTFIRYDMADRAQIESVRTAIESHVGHLDKVILNAGTCEYLDIDSPDWHMMSKINQINYLGMVNSVELCLPLLKKASRPHLVGVSSQAVNAAFPRAEAYGASKAAIRYFLDSLRMDITQYGVDVTCVLPGFVDTPLTQKNDFPMPFLMTSDEAAARIYNALESRPFEYAFPRRLSCVLWFARTFPKFWLRLNATKSKTQA